MTTAMQRFGGSGLFGIVLVIAPAGGLRSAEPPRVCSVHARIADTDVGGTNVRAGPGTNFAVLTHLPHQQKIDGDAFAPELEIIGFEHGWAKVQAIRFADYGGGVTPLYSGHGWLSGKLLSGALQSRLRVAPAASSHMVGEGPASDALESAVIEAIDDCQGSFVHITVRLPDAKHATGWTDGLCANQVTTCN